MSEQRYPVHVAENFLRWNLPANSKDIEARAQAVGIASTTLWRARRRLGVVVKDAVWRLRLAAPRTLHDRVRLVDRSTAWTLGQSFKDLATRSHTTLVRLDPEPGTLKIAAYEQMWIAAAPL